MRRKYAELVKRTINLGEKDLEDMIAERFAKEGIKLEGVSFHYFEDAAEEYVYAQARISFKDQL